MPSSHGGSHRFESYSAHHLIEHKPISVVLPHSLRTSLILLWSESHAALQGQVPSVKAKTGSSAIDRRVWLFVRCSSKEHANHYSAAAARLQPRRYETVSEGNNSRLLRESSRKGANREQFCQGRIFLPIGWYRGHQNVVRASTPCFRDSMRVSQRRHDSPRRL